MITCHLLRRVVFFLLGRLCPFQPVPNNLVVNHGLESEETLFLCLQPSIICSYISFFPYHFLYVYCHFITSIPLLIYKYTSHFIHTTPYMYIYTLTYNVKVHTRWLCTNGYVNIKKHDEHYPFNIFFSFSWVQKSGCLWGFAKPYIFNSRCYRGKSFLEQVFYFHGDVPSHFPDDVSHLTPHNH